MILSPDPELSTLTESRHTTCQVGLKIIVRGYFASEFSLLRHTDEPQKGRNSCLWLQTRYVLSSFGVLLMSCRVKFHVVRSALQYSACRIICLHFYFC